MKTEAQRKVLAIDDDLTHPAVLRVPLRKMDCIPLLGQTPMKHLSFDVNFNLKRNAWVCSQKPLPGFDSSNIYGVYY